MANKDYVQIGFESKGLREFVKGLGKLSPEIRKRFMGVVKDAGSIVVQAAQKKVPKRSGRAAKSLRVSANPGGVKIVGGGQRAPYYPWLDFGGTVGKGRRSEVRVAVSLTRRGTARFAVSRRGVKGTGSVVRPFREAGRYLYPTWSEKQAEVERLMEKAIVDATTAVGVGARRGNH